jgi:glutaminyl-tRNA synthetase
VGSRYIQWVAECPPEKSPIRAKVHIYNPLFTSDNPDGHPDGFLAAINPQSEEIFPNALIEIGLSEIVKRAPWPKTAEGSADKEVDVTLPETVRFQGMRVGYFCLDSESTAEKFVLNQIVSLKEDPNKG